MARKSKILPTSVSNALSGLCRRLIGAVVCLFGIITIFSLLFYHPYYDGFAVASTFGSQSVMGQIVGFVRYFVGVIPALFLFVCVMRYWFVRMIALDTDVTPEYNFLRGFIALSMGAIGLGTIFSGNVYGGMFGAIASYDLHRIMGAGAIIVGIFAFLSFLWLGGVVLHIRWSHVRSAMRMFVRWLRLVLSAFHLTRVEKMLPDLDGDDTEEPTDEPIEEPEPKKVRCSLLRKRTAKKETAVAPVTSVARPRRVSEFQLPDPKFLEKSNFSKCAVTPELKLNARKGVKK